MWDLISSVPDHCLSFCFGMHIRCSSATKFVDLDLFYCKFKLGPLCYCMGNR